MKNSKRVFDRKDRPVTPISRFCVLALAFAFATACGGGRPVHPTSSASGSLPGLVFAGPVSGATVTAYPLSDLGMRGMALATTTTDATGAFTLALPPFVGPLVLAATGGAFPDLATGVTSELDENELSAIVPNYQPGFVGTILVTPISTLAAALTGHDVTAGASFQAAYATATTHLNAHFAALDWTTTLPLAVAGADGGVGLSDSDREGLVLAMLSEEALEIAERAEVTPGVSVTVADLTSALAADLAADGYFDGIGKEGPLALPKTVPVVSVGASGTALDGQTVRFTLANAGEEYLVNPLDTTGLALSDLLPLLNQLSDDSDPTLFRTPGLPFAGSPPPVAFVIPPPAYTNTASLTLEVRATDAGGGVAHVYLQTGSQPPVAMQPVGGLYRSELTLAVGLTSFAIWAVDAAGNSGEGTPAALAFTVIYADTPPVIQVDASATSYTDERGMTLVEADGGPVIPPQYAFPPGSHAAPIAGLDVYKVSTRLSWGVNPPTAFDLDTQDPATLNVPYLVYTIAFDPKVDPPVESVSFQATCVTHCGAFPPASGELIPDPTSTIGLRYLLPLTVETLPALVQITGVAQIDFQITAADAAGNVTTPTQTQVFFHLIGSPVSIAEDTSYPSAGDPHSTFPYLVADGGYAAVYTAANPSFAPDGEVRLVRYLIQNPVSIPVAVAVEVNQTQALGGDATWQALEVWNDLVQSLADYTSESYTAPDGFGPQLQITLRFGLCDGVMYPCGSDSNGLYHPRDFNQEYACHIGTWPFPQMNPERLEAQGDVLVTAYDEAIPDGGVPVPALVAANQDFVVPAATGTTPGQLTLYLNRAPSPHSTPLTWQALNPEVTPAGYQYWEMDYWTYWFVGGCTDPYDPCIPSTDDVYQGFRWYQVLASARTQLTGSFGLVTQSLGLTGPLGEPQTLFTAMSFTRSISN
jgi:hypothetical protein